MTDRWPAHEAQRKNAFAIPIRKRYAPCVPRPMCGVVWYGLEGW